MEVYGLTGGIGSGKSTVAAMLEEYGIPVVTADELSRMVVAPGTDGLADVVAAFGAEVLDERGELDRKKMGRIVVTTPERRRQLEAILHPRIRERYEQVLDALEKAGHPVMVYEVPLLFEKKLDQQDEMTAVILVTASADTRIARIKERDSLTTDDVLMRMRSQMPESEKQARANYVIHNDGNLDDLRREVEYLLSRFLRIPPRPEPLSEDSLEEIVEIEEIEAELEESEIDTLSPEDIAEDETIDSVEPAPAVAAPAPAVAAPAPTVPVTPAAPAAPAAPATPAAPAVPTAAAPAAPPVPAAPAAPPVPAPAAAKPSVESAAPKPVAPSASAPQLEVELHPPSAGHSGSTWIPAGGGSYSASESSRPRRTTAPQLEVPDLPKVDDQESNS